MWSTRAALAVIALRVIRRIGDDLRSTSIITLSSESVFQYTGHAISLFAENTTTRAICVGVRPNCLIPGLTTIASRERNLAAYMLQPPVATTLEPRQRTAPITTHISYTSADFYRENKERLEALLLPGTEPESL